MRIKLLTGVIAALMCITSYAATREIDYAAEDAAVKTIQELENRQIGVSNIAFIGFSGENGDLTHVFRSGLLRVPGSYSFYTRNDKEFDVLLKEIEFGDRRGDVMDISTIKQFGNIKGVDALLYGKLQEAVVEGKNGIVRVTLTLADVETGQLLWSGNITGKYIAETAKENVNQSVIEAAIDAGKQIADKLSSQTDIAPSDIFLLPMVGKMSGDISDMLSTEIISNTNNSSLTFYSEPASVSTNTVRNLSYKLAGAGETGVNQVQLGKLLKQLEQMYTGPDMDEEESKYSENKTKAYLVGNIVNVTESKEGEDAKVIVTFKLRKCSNNQLISGGTVTGKSLESAMTSNESIMKFWNESGLLIKIVGAVLALTILGTFMFLTVRMLTGAR